ncbi:hypothetical protein [Luteimonas saliphila]|uniref:hypothetical protein n=1 Tax=Luteimonas saliphila TaxID=2804919 RepID=UPI00192DE2D4|nr:hypothetical protein [Luteimonas saliphila]
MRADRLFGAVSVAAILALAVPRAEALTILTQEFTCPIGGEVFSQSMAGSGTQFGQDFDLRPYGPTAAPWPLPVCPGNGFVMFKDEFSAGELQRLAAYVEGARYRGMVAEDEASYFRAAALMERLGMPVAERADALLKATWQAGTDAARYRRYAAAALAAHEQSCGQSQADGPGEEGLQCRMLIGELQRRLGRFDAAAATFARARIAHAAIDFESEWLRGYLLHVLDAQDALVAARSTASSRLPPDVVESLRPLR